MLKRSLLVVLALLLVPPAFSAAEDALYAVFQDPSSQDRPFVRWWWNGGCVTEAEIMRELDLMREAGIGGVEINTIEMLEQSVPRMLDDVQCLEWLSPEWNAVVGPRPRAPTPGTCEGRHGPAARGRRVRSASRGARGPEGEAS